MINDSPSIRPETLHRVRQAIDELGYRPNQAARALVTSRSRTIGVLSTQTVHYGPATAINAIETAAREAGYRLSITNISSTEYASIKSGIDYLMSQSIEALIVIAPQVRVFEALNDLQVSVPFVTLEATGFNTSHSLWVDQIQGARIATRHLIELGHTEIMHISGPQDWIEAEARMQGFLRELSDSDLRTRAPILGDWTASFGYYAGLELLRYRDFSAVFVGNDQMALGFMHACREHGLDVPGDISIVGFDDIPESAHFAPPLTTVRQNFAEIGRRAIALLLGELRGETGMSHDPVQPELIVRESTARLA
ncbi:MAG: substrate-binding domain-containing protein [Microcella sp.]|nr:substrate-binding domain-containing protein [Microcella sp.]